MSAFDFQVLRKLFGGQADPHAASLTGDLSQRNKALIARLLQSTSPGLSANVAGSLGEQQQYLTDKMVLLVQQLLSTTPNAQTANSAGSLAQQIAALAVRGGRNLYLPNGVDVWGFDGNLVERDITTNTDTTVGSSNNLRAGGFGVVTGTTSYRQANPIAGRNPTLKVVTGAVSGNVAGVLGYMPLSATVRQVRAEMTSPLPAGFTKYVVETWINTDSLANVDYFVGVADADPVGGAANAAGAIFQASNDAVNWKGFANKAGVITRTAAVAAASTSAVTKVRVEVAVGGAMTVYVNDVASTVIAQANMPAASLLNAGEALVYTRTAGAKNIWIEKHYDRWE